VVDFARREQLQVDVGKCFVERTDDVDVVVEVDVRALPAHHVDLGETGQLVLADRVLDELLGSEGVGVVLLARDSERAELALHTADVRLVQIEVLHEVDAVVSTASTTCEISELAEREDVVALHQSNPVVEVEALACLDLLADRGERAGAFEQHQRSRFTTA
jgi:hypothetical protein